MYYFGTNLEDRFSVPGFWPTAEQSHKIPLDKEEIDRELARMRMIDALRREKRRETEITEAAVTAVRATSTPTAGRGEGD
jgi:protein PET100, fungi type